MTLREQVIEAVRPWVGSYATGDIRREAAADAVLAVFEESERQATSDGYAMGAKHASERAEERERLLRERIEALPKYSIDSREWRRMVCLTDVLGVFDDES